MLSLPHGYGDRVSALFIFIIFLSLQMNEILQFISLQMNEILKVELQFISSQCALDVSIVLSEIQKSIP